MRRLVKALIWILGLVILGIALKITVFKEQPIPVTVARAARGPVEALVVNSKAGTVRTRQRAQISPGVSGIVVELPIKKGQRVAAGDLLLRLDDAEYRARVDIADRVLSSAMVAERDAALQVEQAERDLKRNTPLAAEGAIPASTLDAIQNRRDVAVNGLSAARERIRQARAELEAARTSLAKTRVYAPFPGIIADIRTELGEWLSPSPPGVNIPAVVDLFDPDSIYISAPLDEVDLGKVRLGLPVRITIDPFPDSTFPGRVSRIAPYVMDLQEQNRTFEVEVTFDPGAPLDLFLPGSTADVEVILERKENVLRIPTYSILGDGHILAVVNDRLESHPIQVGLKNWEFTEVKGGVAEGQAVVTSLDRPEVKEGVLVTVSEEPRK